MLDGLQGRRYVLPRLQRGEADAFIVRQLDRRPHRSFERILRASPGAFLVEFVVQTELTQTNADVRPHGFWWRRNLHYSFIDGKDERSWSMCVLGAFLSLVG